MDTINRSSYTKYAMYTALPLAGAAAGLAVPVKDKTTKYRCEAVKKHHVNITVDKDGFIHKKTPRSISTFLIKIPNKKQKIINSIIGAILGLGCAALINKKCNTK